MKPGAYAAIVQAICYIFGFALLMTIMNPGNTEGWSQLQKLDFILEREHIFQLWNFVIYVVFGVALVVLAVVLHRLLNSNNSLWMMIATPFGLIWAGLVIASGMIASIGLEAVSDLHPANPEAATQLWTTVGVLQNGLGGGVELVGGVWIFLISIWSLRSKRLLPTVLNWLGMLAGIAGILTVVPGLSALGAVFGLIQIIWFLWIGVVLLKSEQAQTRQ
ncbi:MAG: DUF4386 family protein [Wenzhouxiangella sp.]|jgi:hypothetical protein|nr:DUF4386 family protein [Wenzhouxiangella sp.]